MKILLIKMRQLLKVNDFTLLLLSIFYILLILFSDNTYRYIILMSCALLNVVFLRQFKYRYLAVIVLSMLPGLIVIFLIASLFANTLPQERHYYIIYNLFYCYQIKLYYANVKLAGNLVLRTLSLAVCSVIFIMHIDLEQITICAMKQLKLPVKIGYAILAINNAFYFMQGEFKRMRDAYCMRFHRNLNWYRLLYPVLIAAARYATICGMSLEARGLNDKKTFIRNCPAWQLGDSVIIGVNISIVVVLYLLKL